MLIKILRVGIKRAGPDSFQCFHKIYAKYCVLLYLSSTPTHFHSTAGLSASTGFLELADIHDASFPNPQARGIK